MCIWHHNIHHSNNLNCVKSNLFDFAPSTLQVSCIICESECMGAVKSACINIKWARTFERSNFPNIPSLALQIHNNLSHSASWSQDIEARIIFVRGNENFPYTVRAIIISNQHRHTNSTTLTTTSSLATTATSELPSPNPPPTFLATQPAHINRSKYAHRSSSGSEFCYIISVQ